MPSLQSKLIVTSRSFRENQARMLGELEQITALWQKVQLASASKADAFAKKGQLLPRERVARLVDRDAPFLELCALAGLGMHDDKGEREPMGGGSIVGIGVVQKKRCVVMANDSALKGGTVSPMGLKKSLRAQEIAQEQKLPIVYLVESGGANLMYQSELFVEGGRSFANQARLSASGIPQVAVVHGSSTAGGAYLPGLSDYVVLVTDRSKIFLAGPPLVKAAIGEDTTDEELGGVTLHAETTGLGEYVAKDDAEALALTRELFDKLAWDEVREAFSVAPPLYDPSELLGVVPADEREPYDVREVIARLTDRSDFLEFKARYGPATVCGHARIDGRLVGILGNNGPIQPQGSSKAAQFIQLCDQSGTPLVFLQNTTGYMVGQEAERNGAIKHGAKMIQAVANARVAKLTIVLGGSFGAGNYGMCGRGFSPSFIFSWPSARTAVMGGAQAAKVMEIITLGKLQRAGQTPDLAQVQAMAKGLTAQLDKEAHVLFGTARLWDDGVIDPRDTRRVLALCLAICAESRERTLRPNTFGVARM